MQIEAVPPPSHRLQMNLYFAKRNHDELPPRSECEVGDLAMLTSGDVFCYMGNMWKMIGGRWVDPKLKQTFFNYIKSGWPDYKTLAWDLECIFDLTIFEQVTDFVPNENSSISSKPIWFKKFKEEILETCKKLEQLPPPPSITEQI